MVESVYPPLSSKTLLPVLEEEVVRALRKPDPHKNSAPSRNIML